MDLLDSHNNTMKGTLFFPPLYRWENWGTETLSSFPKITKNLTQGVCSRICMLNHHGKQHTTSWTTTSTLAFIQNDLKCNYLPEIGTSMFDKCIF